jgi:hypothetical protein
MPPPGSPPGPEREAVEAVEAVEALPEVRERLAALDDLPLDQHPAVFAAIDELLRSALDGADRAESDAGSRLLSR